MKVTLCVAADLYGTKVNLEVTFPSMPSLPELTRQVETTFSIEASSIRPPGQAFIPFKIARFHIFDDRLGQWVELLSSNQLTEFAQLYAFQQNAPAEEQRQIPPARAPLSSAAGQSSIARSPSRMKQTSPPRASLGATSPPRPLPLTNNNGGLNASAVTAAAAASSASFSSPSNGRGTLGGSATAVATRFAENASFEAKIRAVFDELDINRDRVIGMDEWRRALKTLRVDLSTATVNDLFARGDTDKDGVISMHEFHGVGVNYPTLLDSLYFRSKEFYDEQRRRGVVDGQRGALDESHQKEGQAKAAHDGARRDLENQERNLALQEQELQAKLLKERDTRQSQMEAAKDRERALYEKGERDRDLTGGRDRERQRHVSVVESQRGVEGAERRVQSQESELARSQEKERQLEALLAEARRETERQTKGLQVATGELSSWRDREQQALSIYADAQAEVARLAEALAQAELEVARRVEKEREAEAMMQEAQRETARASARRDEEERDLTLQRERELHLSRLHQESLRAIEEADRNLKSMEQDLADYLSRREQIEAQEMPLIEQEIRLREQRFNLEEREGKLRNETASFTITAGRNAMSPATPGNLGASSSSPSAVGPAVLTVERSPAAHYRSSMLSTSTSSYSNNNNISNSRDSPRRSPPRRL